MTEPAIEPPPCIWCGTGLKSPDVAICPTCKLWQPRGRCRVCHKPMTNDASECKACKSVDAVLYKHCRVCQAGMPKNAARCNACSSYQSWWRHVAYLAPTLAALGLVAGVIPWAARNLSEFRNRHSDTSFVVAGATRDAVVLSVSNTGRSASVLRRFRLEFGSLPLEPVELAVLREDRENGKTYIAPGTQVVRLQALGITHCDVTKEQVRALLSSAPDATLTISIKESDDPATGPWTKVPEKVPVSLLRPFILEAIPDDP